MRYRVPLAAWFSFALVFGTAAAHASLPEEVYLPVAVSTTTATFQGGGVAGSRYTTTQDITFNSLGFIDVNTNLSNFNNFNVPDVLVGSYQVGIWLNSTQALLASATVTPSSPLALTSQFRYAPIPPTTILAGQSFTVGALLPESPLDAWLIGDVSVNSVGITGPGSGFFLAGGSLSFPTQGAGNTYAVANASTAVVPEPTGVAGIVVSLGCLATFRRRRRIAIS